MTTKEKIELIAKANNDIQKEQVILRALPKGARLKYIGSNAIERKVVPGSKPLLLKPGTYCYKIRNCKGKNDSDKMLVYACGNNQWSIPYYQLTNDLIEVTKKLIG